MARALAFLQFLIIGIGAFSLHLLVKLDNGSDSPLMIEIVVKFLARYALWLLAIPILWAVFAISMQSRMSEKRLNAFWYFSHGFALLLACLASFLLSDLNCRLILPPTPLFYARISFHA